MELGEELFFLRVRGHPGITESRSTAASDVNKRQVWYRVIREFRPDRATGRLDLTFESDPPYCLAGPWVPYLTVIVTTLLAGDRGVAAVEDALAAPLGV